MPHRQSSEEARELSPLNVPRLEERGITLSTRQFIGWTGVVFMFAGTCFGFGLAFKAFLHRMDRMEAICKITQQDVAAIKAKIGLPPQLGPILQDGEALSQIPSPSKER